SWISLYVFSSILYLYIFVLHLSFFFFFFTVTPTPEIYTLSLHDALPIFCAANCAGCAMRWRPSRRRCRPPSGAHCRRGPDRKSRDRKSTRLNSSHSQISYADFRLKKNKLVSGTTRLSTLVIHLAAASTFSSVPIF